MILRPATLADRAAVVQLALAFHGSTPYAGLLDVDPDRLGAQFDVALQHGVIFVAEVEAALVGFFALAALDHGLSGDRYAEEMGWWVEPAYRAGTVGPQLLRRAEEWARAHACRFLKMVQPFGADVLGRFYERQGYAPIETAFIKRVA